MASGKINAPVSLLWTNPSPSSSFPGQTITLSDSAANYRALEVVFITNNTVSASSYVIETVQFSSGYRMHAWYWGASDTAAFFVIRQITNPVTDTSISFSSVFHSPNLGTVSQNMLVPWKVYGLK